MSDDFFTRNALSPSAKDECDAFALLFHPVPVPCAPQGYCSYTLSVGAQVLQFRPEAYKLDLETCRSAKRTYGRLAPDTTYLGCVAGLHAYLLEKMPGRPVSRPSRALMEDLAEFFALGFRARRPRTIKGRVGSSIEPRLALLEGHLPPHLRGHATAAQRVLSRMQEEGGWCLTHGDLLPRNILVDEEGRMTGVLDWAEAEWLPCGMALYAVEELLYDEEGLTYCAEHEELRSVFWEKLLALCGSESQGRLADLQVFRKVGILLWFGIAFDEGRLDRVVQEGRDDEQLRRLEVFLKAQTCLDMRMRL